MILIYASLALATLVLCLAAKRKMEAIGTLAGGIAHDFNNILSIILGYTSLVLEEIRGLDDGFRHARFGQSESRDAASASASIAEVRENLDTVMQAGRRARDLVEQILTPNRHTEHEKNPIDLRPVVKEVMKLMRSTLPATIEIDQQIDSSAMVVLADPSQIHQVLMNLCTNAGHAMDEDGGKLNVSLQLAELGSRALAKFGDLAPGHYAHLRIADNGYGMDEATRERIFEPFFTTKELGEGTGLGQSVVHGIVSDHAGAISVDSKLGEGATFEIIVPVYSGTKNPPRRKNRMSQRRAGGGCCSSTTKSILLRWPKKYSAGLATPSLGKQMATMR